MRGRFVGKVQKWLGTPDGNAPLEFALLAPVLLLLAMGLYDFGRFALQQQQVVNAARAGAQFGAMNQSNSENLDGMIAMAKQNARDDGALHVDARRFCLCPSAPAEVSCNATCPDGEFALVYVEVTARDRLDLLLRYPGLASVPQAEARSRVRVR